MSLEDVESIKRLKARYFRLLDTKRWDDWRNAFTDDCGFEGTTRPYKGPDEFVAGTRERLGDALTIHHGHMPEVLLTSVSTARGVWAMFDWVEFPDERDIGFGRNWGFTGYGYYEEEYRKEQGVWKIAFLRLTRIKVTAIVGDRPRPTATPWLATSDRDWLADGS